MSELTEMMIKMMDDQMLKWVAELDKLHKSKADIDKTVHQLEQRIDVARQLVEFLK